MTDQAEGVPVVEASGRGRAATRDARRSLIAEQVIRRGTLTIDELVHAVGVSPMTIYRDVAALEDAGVLRRSRGNVSALATSLHEAGATMRLDQNPGLKTELAKAVASRITPGMSLMIDDSTSGVFVLRALEGVVPLTVVTNSMLVARELEHRPSVQLFVTGGLYQGWAEALLGRATVDMVRSMHVDVALLSASGVSEGRLYHPHEDAGDVKRAMMESARTKILLLDHTKFHRHALHEFAHVRDFDLVVVDDQLAPGIIASLRDSGVELLIV
ncbi:MAG: DeoR/GlpR family DNA-binding transcription regulator, partial [Propionibacteriaceae bacterium]|nr:DeoR/GlpR family DNA-binding transcription regulator [Propionibacteriaceae bacterium]